MILQLDIVGIVFRTTGREAVLVGCNAGEDEERKGEDTTETQLAPDLL